MKSYLLFHLINVAELAEIGLCLSKLLSNKPYITNVCCLKQFHNLLMFFCRRISKFTHITEDSHLILYLHQLKVLYRSSHTGWISIISIHNKLVMCCLSQLRTIVVRHIVLQSIVDLLWRNTKVKTNSNGCQHII